MYNMNIEEDMSLTNELKNLNQEAIEQLIDKVKNEFQKDLVAINQIYKDSIVTLLEREQGQIIAQHSQKSQILQWVQLKLNELPQYADHESSIKNLIIKSKQQIAYNCQAQKCLTLGLIDQITKELGGNLPKKQENISFKCLRSELNPTPDTLLKYSGPSPKITCLFCSKSDFELAAFRQHLKDSHQMVFQGFKCNDCNYDNKSIEDFSDHVIKVHNKKMCVCKSTFPTKHDLRTHLKQCLKFFKQHNPIQKSISKFNKKKDKDLLCTSYKNKN